MPSRIVREGILSSDRVNALSPMAELFYRRLLNVVDDYGRFHGAPATLRAACWPTCPDKITEKQVIQWLSECLANDNPLIIRYHSGSSVYVQVTDFRQQVRAKSRFPEPPICEANANQMESECETDAQPSRIPYSEVVFRIPKSYSASPKNGSATTHGSRFTLESIPEAWANWCFHGLTPAWDQQRAEAVFAKFADYWKEVPGSRGRKVDWIGTWRNWCRKEAEEERKAVARNGSISLFEARESATERAIRIGHERIVKEGRL